VNLTALHPPDQGTTTLAGDHADSAAKHTPSEANASLVAPDQPKVDGISAQGSASATAAATLLTRSYDAIKIQPVDWFWRNRLAFGKYSLFAGVPGVGKTFAACDMIARASKGTPFPDGSPAPLCESLIVTAEDAPEDTIAPRLLAHGCDMTKVHHLDAVKFGAAERFFEIGESCEALAKWLEQRPAVRNVVLDPITAFLGDGVDSHKNSEVRHALVPLIKVVEKHGVALTAITHLSKGQSRAINRIIGSIAFVAAARACWLIDWDPETEERRLFLEVKNNLAHADGLTYTIRNDRVVWEEGAVRITADELSDSGYLTPREEAEAWLRQTLQGGPVSSTQIVTQAEREGIARRTLNRAKKNLEIVSERRDNAWLWMLPAHGADISEITQKAKAGS
jgi:hypothetical protein